MCGIAGILSSNTNDVSEYRLRRMTDAIKHRGPDGEGFWINARGEVGLGHRRLSIIDLSPAGAQPMHYLSRYTITYNGEIYNYIELREELQKRNYTFSSSSDTEVILAAYAHYGTNCLQHFDGMFAFAIWDEEKQELFCARDRFGEKPFYYHEAYNSFYFASEMKALWAVGIDKQVSNTLLLNYLTVGYTSDHTRPNNTFFNEINTLLPGHYLLLKMLNSADDINYEFDVINYWDLDKESPAHLNEIQALEKFTSLFDTSVQRRLRSDVPIGTSLSGGLDSSSIVATAHKFLSKNNNYQQATFSAVFPGFDKDEARHIHSLSLQYKLQNHFVTPTAIGLVNDFVKMQHHHEEPVQSASIYAQYKVYELAKQHGITVLLDGQGADEILAGYLKYYHWYWQELISKTQWALLGKERSAAKALGAKVDWGFNNYLAAFFPVMATEKLNNRAIKNQKAHPALSKDFLNTYADETSFEKPVVEKLNDILYFNTMHHGLQELLRYADRNSMAHSREVRLPFLNHKLVQFVFSLPSHFKIKEGITKWLLRQSMNHRLPHEIAWRKDKVGFEPPQQAWMQNKQMQDFIHESKKKLVKNKVLKKEVLDMPIIPQHAHDANNYDWRYLSAAHCI